VTDTGGEVGFRRLTVGLVPDPDQGFTVGPDKAENGL
jgi:hypothetical protein